MTDPSMADPSTPDGAERRGLRARLCGQRGALRIEVELSCGPGPLVLVGPNGSGKTSVLRMLLGALRPESGTIALDGELLFDSANNVDVPVERRGLGYVPQGYALFPHLSALDNVALPFALRDGQSSRSDQRERARALLARFDAERLAERKPRSLSGGEQQRVALARALAANPRALLLDEPLAALDARARRELRAALAADLTRLALPALIVTHDPADALALAPHVAVLEAGRIVQQGPVETLRSQPASAFVADLFS
ncbi:MAG TPA: ABC transporter ATP-binding protein [Polyangiales bacterium]|nr:ABC transporter ATP-binding protein [Polyangiales bacterium]